MNNYLAHVSPATISTVWDALLSLMGKKPRFGLPAPVTDCKIAPEGTEWKGKKIHFWVTICGNIIGLRVFEHSSRPKRKVLRDLLSKNEPPTLLVYAQMRSETIAHKLAQCLKTGLNRIRYGLIEILKPERAQGLIHRCDYGSVLTCGFRRQFSSN